MGSVRCVGEHLFVSLRKRREYAAARRLRSEGGPLKRIAATLEVSPSTIFYWTRDITLTPEQRARNLRGPRGPLNPERLRKRTEEWITRCRTKRALYQEQGRARAREGRPLHLAGCMLYWAEGAKSRNRVKFVNSDPQMLLVFRRFLTEELEINPHKIGLRLNVYTGNGLSLEEIESYWLNLLELPAECLRKHTLNHRPTSSSGRARKKLPYGVCALTVHETRLAQHIYGAIREYAGFQEPRWLE